MLILTNDAREQIENVTLPSPRRRARRLIVVCVVASAAVHATVFSLVPGFAHLSEAPAAVLEVMLRDPEPLPVASPEPEIPIKPNPVPKQKHMKTKAPLPSAPVLALPEQRSQESSLTVPVPKSAEPLPPAQESKSQVASVTVTPPAFNAAYLRNPAPRYPIASRRAGEQGTVTLRVLVSSDGLPTRVNVEKTSGWDNLDSAALDAVKGWRFRPAQRGTEPVEGWVLVPIVFRLEGPS